MKNLMFVLLLTFVYLMAVGGVLSAQAQPPEDGWSIEQRIADAPRKAEVCGKSRMSASAVADKRALRVAITKCHSGCNMAGPRYRDFLGRGFSAADAGKNAAGYLDKCESAYHEIMALVDASPAQGQAAPQSVGVIKGLKNPVYQQGVDGLYKACKSKDYNSEALCSCVAKEAVAGINAGTYLGVTSALRGAAYRSCL